MNYYIYALYASDSDEIRYIGQTKNSLKQRLCEHISDSFCKKTRCKSYKNKWIQSVYNRGEKVLIKPIEEVTEENINEREIYWIDYYKTRVKLTNQLPGGNSGGLGGKVQNFLPYNEAKELIKELSDKYNIVSISTYKKFLKEHEEYHKLLPKNPDDVYKFRGTWVSWKDYLSSKFLNGKENSQMIIDLDTLKKIVHDNKIKNEKEYKTFRLKNNNYNGKRLPAYPDRVYSKSGWSGYTNFWYKDEEKDTKEKCKTKKKRSYVYRGYFTIYGLKKYLWQFNFKTPSECIDYLSGHRYWRIPENIPEHYMTTGEWRGKGWGYLLKRGNCCSEEVFRRYLKIYKINEHIHSVKDWYVYCKENNVSKKVPRRICLQYGKPESDFFAHIKPHYKSSKNKVIVKEKD